MQQVQAGNPPAIAVTVRGFGDGVRVATFSGVDRAAVLEAALDYRAKVDPELEPSFPTTYPGSVPGVWRADVNSWAAE